jgi:phospholipase/carboxylesterase
MRRQVYRSSTLEYLTVYPDGYQEGAVYPVLIWLHGFGADMYDLASLANTFHPSGYLHVFPNAPLGGFDGPEGTVRAWFERGGKEMPESVRRALAGLDAFVEEVLAKFRIQSGQALLLGFSQGGNLALRFGLSRPKIFAGLAALSCSLRQAEDLRASLPVERTLPILMAHGAEDEMVSVECSRRIIEFLKEQGYLPIYHEFTMGHEINEELLAMLTAWINETLPSRLSGPVA